MSKCFERVFKKKKNSRKPNAASHNNTSWYTVTDGFLEHSPSGGSLYYKRLALWKIIPVFFAGVSPRIIIESLKNLDYMQNTEIQSIFIAPGSESLSHQKIGTRH